MAAYKIEGGKVYDPLLKTFSEKDIFIENGFIGTCQQAVDYTPIDARGCYVTPGFIDYHVHYFNHGSDNGVNADATSFPTGTTTVVDGGSCGVSNYGIYDKSIVSHSDVRILSLLHVASGGQVTNQYPESIEPSRFDVAGIKEMFKAYPDKLVGLKTRMSEGLVPPDQAEASLAKTIEIAEDLGCPVIVHMTSPAMDLEKLAGMLRKNDVFCHMYQNKGSESILDDKGSVRKAIAEAAERGVLFDACNGRNNFNLDIAGRAIEQGFKPHIISSDINVLSCYEGILHSLPKIMSKYLAFGMSLEEVLDATILSSARQIDREDLATLREGTAADVTIFRLREGEVVYRDYTAENSLTGNQLIVPQMTIKSGRIMYSQIDFNL